MCLAIEGYESESNGDTKVTEVASLGTGTTVGLKMGEDEATGDLSALQIYTTHKQARYSYNTLSHTLPALTFIHVL